MYAASFLIDPAWQLPGVSKPASATPVDVHIGGAAVHGDDGNLQRLSSDHDSVVRHSVESQLVGREDSVFIVALLGLRRNSIS